jgi:prepilin-type N-terminal cleavage/methylation domain-containing protein/prepilin-type processing-associated H-X9-DG protein
MLKKRSMRRAAFTLLEVMVVTTIITSQANNYGDVKRLAYQKSCENNLRQIYAALQMYEITHGNLPRAKFYPKKPKRDSDSLVVLLGPGYEQICICPVFPGEIKDKGLTYLYNDEVGGRSIDQIRDSRNTWLVTEMNAVSDTVPMPHPGGFHILYADGRIVVTKERPAVFVEMQKKAEEQKKKKAPERT